MNPPVTVVQYWGGCPQVPNSKWRRVLEIVRRCAREGWNSHLAWSARPDDSDLTKPFVDAGCEITIHPRARGNFDLACIRRTRRWLRHIGATIIHCQNVHTSPLIAAALARVPIRLWYKLAMSPYYENGTKPHGLHRMQPSTRLSVALCQRVMCLSTPVRDELIATGIKPSKLIVYPPPIPTASYKVERSNELRRELNLEESKFVVTAVGHAVPVKGWDILIRAFTQITESAPNARLLLVGGYHRADEKETYNQLIALTRKLNLQDHITFTGQRSDIADILAASDLFAFPSRSEGLGLALLEAMAAGLPCVAANVGGIPDAIAHERNGLLFDREDVDGLAKNLLRMIRDNELRRNLADAARQSAQTYSLESQTERLFELYRELLVESKR